LIIEDEEVLLRLLQKKLIQEGYEVKIAEDGEKGLAEMREFKPDLILLDIIMSKVGGFEVMEEMNKDPELKNISIIIISNSGQPIELSRAKELGARDWLIKAEFDPEEVVQKVKLLIGQ
jgi:DNA-binding response OmpR family regulator